ncbi:MAG: bifunctional adenosylcobinamide kinase/adenosylcobinamide-phosphate guanylyltransferase [Oscillospiraceae bacterium]|nr:bifunctional adenosylcobinamide kinase/adenosylcobinamide-phosphate guanylyltransferase [Oscillospiraceae bacterium]
MTALVLGGAASGKSEYAESLILASPHKPRIYVAAMICRDSEDAARIARHQALRAEKGFLTVERPLDLGSWECPLGAAVLVECMTNLLANELYEPNGAGIQAPEKILTGLQAISDRAGTLVVVSGDIFADGKSYDTETRQYQRMLSQINRGFAALADTVKEIVCGIPLDWKAWNGKEGNYAG